jgi:hypothetical protein
MACKLTSGVFLFMLYADPNLYKISTNNIAIGMIRDGHEIHFHPPKVRFQYTLPKRFLY